ncbi:hypothetical protein FLJC2902T_32410 [Flavobacterium limnosediminis JC2902]|uniref:Uncharacterized protein n=2 Tax=Flavobacterium TaxID=237 RepID=V6S9M5_9FLAO|nr:hypothetical protein FLJC2902T_32410 [Flavobacterium limnosediminis JC2902]
MQVGTFITDVYKYTEKIERKRLTSKKKMQTLTITDTSLKPHLHKTLVSGSLLLKFKA